MAFLLVSQQANMACQYIYSNFRLVHICHLSSHYIRQNFTLHNRIEILLLHMNRV